MWPFSSLSERRREEEESGEAEARILARVLPPQWNKEGAPRDIFRLKVIAVASSLVSGGQETALVRRYDLGTPPAQATFRIMRV